MADDYVWIDPQQASNGIAQWDAAAGAAKTHWDEHKTNAESAAAAAPWGNDEAGQNFASQYAGAELFANADIDAIFTKLVETGANVRTAVNTSLASDDEQAAGVTGVIESGIAPTE